MHMKIRFSIALFCSFGLLAFCEPAVEQRTTHIDQARLKEIELLEKIYNDKRKDEQERRAAAERAEEKRRAVAEATARAAEQERRIAEQERRAAARRALDEEIRRLATSTNRFEVLVAELRSRQGRLQLKLAALPSDIAEAEKDFDTLDAIMIGCMQTVVTNVRQRVGIFTDKTIPSETVIERKSLSPGEYVSALKSNPDLNGILSKYDSRMVRHSLDRIVENYAYETDRLNRELEEVRSGKGSFNTAQRNAVAFNSKILDRLRGRLRTVDGMIRDKERDLQRLNQFHSPTAAQAAERDRLGAALASLRGEREDLDSKISIAEGQSLFGRASEVGVSGSFKSQEFSIRNEYEANLRESVDDARNTVLAVVDTHRRERAEEFERAKEELAAIQLILDAHTNGTLTLEQKATLLQSVDAKQGRDLSNAAAVLWADK
jgi:hypothetical protein